MVFGNFEHQRVQFEGCVAEPDHPGHFARRKMTASWALRKKRRVGGDGLRNLARHV